MGNIIGIMRATAIFDLASELVKKRKKKKQKRKKEKKRKQNKKQKNKKTKKGKTNFNTWLSPHVHVPLVF